MRRKASRRGDRLIDFLKCRGVIFSIFLFFYFLFAEAKFQCFPFLVFRSPVKSDTRVNERSKSIEVATFGLAGSGDRVPSGLIELRDARSEPSSAGRHTDKEHGAATLGRWRRHQHIVNPEVAVGRQRDARNVRTELGEGRRGFTNQRREHAGVAVRADGIASAQQQAPAIDANTPVDLHVRSEIGDHPDLAGRDDAADNVLNHVREAAVRVGGTRHVRYRNITDSSPESNQRLIGYYRRSKGSSYEDHKNRCKQTLFHNFTFISFSLFSFYFPKLATYGGHILL